MADKGKEIIIENYRVQSKSLLEQGYTETQGIISVARANAMAFVTAGPFALAVLVIYLLVWQGMSAGFGLWGTALFLLSMVVSIPVHEFIHGFTWHWFCKNRWQSIYFGVMRRSLTPYCHCKEPLSFGAYIVGCLMPFVVLGLGISTLAIVLGSPGVLWLGIFNILAAGGDTTIALMLRKHPHDLLLDHPTKCGFVAFAEPKDMSE